MTLFWAESHNVLCATKILAFTLFAKKPLTATLPIALFALPIQFCCSHSAFNFVFIVYIQWYMATDAWSDPWLPIMIYQRLFTDKLGVVWSSKQSLWWPSRRHNVQFEFDFMGCNLTVIPQTSRDVVTKAIANSQFIKLLIFYEKAGDRFLSMFGWVCWAHLSWIWIEYPSLLTDLFSRAFPRAFFFYVWSNSFLVLFALALKPEAQTWRCIGKLWGVKPQRMHSLCRPFDYNTTTMSVCRVRAPTETGPTCRDVICTQDVRKVKLTLSFIALFAFLKQIIYKPRAQI